MTLTVIKKRNWKVLFNLHADLHVRLFDMVTRQHSVRFSAVVVSKVRLTISFPDKTNRVLYELCLTRSARIVSRVNIVS